MHIIKYYGIFILFSLVSVIAISRSHSKCRHCCRSPSSQQCSVNIDDSSQWPGNNPPILLDEVGNFIIPDVSGSFRISDGESFMLGCPGTSFNSDPGDILLGQCSSGVFWLVNIIHCVLIGWAGDLEVGQETVGSLSEYGCQRQPEYTTEVIGGQVVKLSLYICCVLPGSCGPDDKAMLIQIEFDVDPALDNEGVTITVCHHPVSAASLWSQHILYNEIVTKAPTI